MGFRSTRRSKSPESTTTGQTTRHQRSSRQQSSWTQRSAEQPIRTTDIEQGEQHFGMTIPDERTLQRLQIAEDTHGQRVHEWIDEGMPADMLGKTRDMKAFRQRQAERPPEVPTNIERQNRRSVLRSEQAAADTGSAGEAGVPESVREVISSTGRSLDVSIQRAMEDRMGDSLGEVRIHTGPQAAAACEAINARAFTVGNHIAFNQGEYDPASPEGQHVLAHELAHVRQQTGGAVSMLPQDDVELEIDPDPTLEREAEETAQRVMAGGELGIQRLADTEVHVQRRVDDKPRGQVTDTVAFKNDLKTATAAMKAAGKEFSKRFVPNELMAAYEAGKAEEKRQSTDEIAELEQQLERVQFPASWMEDLEAMGPPEAWKAELKAYAEDVAKSVTNGNNTKF